MLDLALNDNGDILFEIDENISEESLTLNFIIAKTTALRLNFYINNEVEEFDDADKLMLSFEIVNPLYDKNCTLIKEEEAVEQAIKLRISTSLNSVLGNTDMGSKVEEYKHKNIDEKELFEHISKEIKRCLSDIMPNCKVSIARYKTYYREFYNALKITVINKGKDFYYYL